MPILTKEQVAQVEAHLQNIKSHADRAIGADEVDVSEALDEIRGELNCAERIMEDAAEYAERERD